MPLEWISALHRASLLCQDEAVNQLLQQIPSEYAVLARKLERLTHSFEFQPIIDASRIYLDIK